MKYAIVHIADIHYQKEKPEGSASIIKAFIKDLEQQKKLLSEHDFYIALTGDIVFSGDDNAAYDSFKGELDKQLDDIGILKNYRMIVPGNHDVERNVIQENFDKHCEVIVENTKKEEDFNDFISDNNILKHKFANYELFESEFAKYGIDFTTQGKGWNIDTNLGVYCLNTSLCSLAGLNKSKDEKKLAIYTRELVDWCNKKETSVNILLMHHPIDDFTEWSKQEAKQIIENNFSLCLCGHHHEQDVFYNKISQNSLVCAAPQLFSKKEDALGYAIIIINENNIEQIKYRQYEKGSFLNGSSFSENDEGVVYIQNNYSKNKNILESKLNNALSFFKNQPQVFIEPKLSKTREFNDDENLLYKFIENPESAMVIAQPQFGLTCLAHYMRLEAYKNKKCWIYIDADHIKLRKLPGEIDEQLENFGESADNIECIIIDSWNSMVLAHQKILKYIDENYIDIPIIIMSSNSEYNFSSSFDFSVLNNDFAELHLQALERTKVRELVANYSGSISKTINEDEIVSKVVKDLKVLNIHRTPLNCLTLLKVFEWNFNESLMNRTKMIKAVLFILFTDSESFRYSSNKPEVDDCEFILGKFCKTLIERKKIKFKLSELMEKLSEYCTEKLISVDVDIIIDILEANNILLRFGDELEFKHRYWIFYFAATYMLRDDKFKDYIFNDRNYVNFPEIIEFYTGIDGRRENAVKILTEDTKKIIEEVNCKIGIPEEFNPFNDIVWSPSDDSIKQISENIKEKVDKSNLPTKIKDQHADKSYDSEAPYDQSLNRMFSDFSVISLLQAIIASSRALRNSNYIDPDLKIEMLQTIINGWEQISRVLFWVSPTLAHCGSASYCGWSLILSRTFTGSYIEKLKNIYLANPLNVVNYLKDDISSKKMGPLLFKNLQENTSEIQKHFIALLLIKEKPIGWYKKVFHRMNLLHANSFYLKDLCNALKSEIKHGFISKGELKELNNLISIVVVKHKNAPKLSKAKKTKIPIDMIVSTKNELPIDMIFETKDKLPMKMINVSKRSKKH